MSHWEHSTAGRRGARVQGRLFGNELFLKNRNVLNQLHTVRNRSVHDLLNPLRKTFLMDLLDTFHKLHLDLRDGHVCNVFNGALLRTLFARDDSTRLALRGTSDVDCTLLLLELLHFF